MIDTFMLGDVEEVISQALDELEIGPKLDVVVLVETVVQFVVDLEVECPVDKDLDAE